MTTWLILVLSLLAGFATLIVERWFGIDLDYHPDSRTYLDGCDLPQLPELTLGTGFYLLVCLFGGSSDAMIAFNIVCFSITNVILYRTLKSTSKSNFALWLFLFLPYKLHLTAHVLKESLIILILVFSLTFARIYVLPLFFLGFRACIYSLILLTPSVRLIAFIVIFVGFYALGIVPTLLETSTVNMTFRDYDRVPNFNDFEIAGSLLRALLWPALYLSGFYLFFFQTPLALPLFLGNLIFIVYIKSTFRELRIAEIYFILAVLAFLVPGFTSFFRYAFPILVVWPLYLRRVLG